MDKREIIRRLHDIVDARLFGSDPWLVDRESADRLKIMLVEMGVEEQVPGGGNSWRNTSLGNELRLDLLLVFMGAWDPWEMPEILEEHGLIQKRDVQRLSRVLSRGGGWEGTFKEYVRRAYFAFYNPTQLVS